MQLYSFGQVSFSERAKKKKKIEDRMAVKRKSADEYVGRPEQLNLNQESTCKNCSHELSL